MAHRPGREAPPPAEREPDKPAHAYYEVPPGEGVGETPAPHPSSRLSQARRWRTEDLQRAPGWRCLDCPTVVRGGDGAMREVSWVIHHDHHPTHHREILP